MNRGFPINLHLRPSDFSSARFRLLQRTPPVPPSLPFQRNPSALSVFSPPPPPPQLLLSSAMGSVVKEEIAEAEQPLGPAAGPGLPLCLAVIDLSSSDDSDSDDDEGVCMAPEKKPRALDGAAAGGPLKKLKSEDGAAVFVLPLGFLDPLPREDARPAPPPPPPLPAPQPISVVRPLAPAVKGCRQFWKAGDYEGDALVESASLPAGIDHVRVHPKFLHSNATSHKWALGAIAELLDNAVDEVCNGATFVNVDVLENRKDMTKMLSVEDNGGGMDPDRVRQCMSLGYSVKSKSANTIGQYGNGFKTSTMRLGADVVVFSRCRGKGGKSSTQTIGMLSYTFLRDTGKEDIMVPMLDYEKGRESWNKLVRTSTDDWNKNLETIVQWSPFSSEDDLLQQFGSMTDQGTRIVIYNLWEDDQGQLELDFGTDRHDIQARGVNRDEKKIQMAKQFPNSRHFLTYQHSLRSYASILYLRLPQDFRIILRGKEIEHHDIVDDMMHKQEVTYKPQNTSDGTPRDPNMVAVVRIGFVKDAKDHIDIQGFNVYHKNRLIKPFWRVWNASGSGGRGVIGVLEANFVEPAHDKQGFERTTVLARLEARLVQMQKSYWGKHSHMVGYGQQTRKMPSKDISDKETSPEAVLQQLPGFSKNETQFQRSTEKGSWSPVECSRMKDGKYVNGRITSARENEMESGEIFAKKLGNSQGTHTQSYAGNNGQSLNASSDSRTSASSGQAGSRSNSKETGVTCNRNEHKLQNTDVVSFEQLKNENRELKERLKKIEDGKKLLIEKREEAEKKLEEANKEQEALIDIFSEERKRRDMEEENLRKRLKDASATIQQLLDRLSCNRN